MHSIPQARFFLRYCRSAKTIQLDNLQLIDQTLKIADNDYGSFSSSLLSGKLEMGKLDQSMRRRSSQF
jgi:hypothetical protein